MGGLARRVSYIKAFREKLGGIPSLVVDSGFFLGDELATHGSVRADIAVRNENVFRAHEQFPVDVVNLSAHDLRFVSGNLGASTAGGQRRMYPILKRLVSANILAESSAIPTHAIRELPARTDSGGRPKPIRVAFIGLTEAIPHAPPGFRIIDPVEAARKVVPQAKRSADFVIVLARGTTPEILRVAREVTGIDVIIGGNGDVFTAPVQVGQTLIVFTPYETRTFGELRVYRNNQGQFSARARYISLDSGVPDDPEALRLVTEATNLETEARKSNKALLQQWLARTQMQRTKPPDKSGDGAPEVYAGSIACAQCHTAQYIQWSNTTHARASDRLILKGAEFEMGCLACHASGLEKSGVVGSGALPKLQNVQCEQCHGPAIEHVAKPSKGYGRVADLNASCSGCHTPQTSPAFDVQAAWQKIRH